jgi:tetratricopeptide (TPR) repeat protein
MEEHEIKPTVFTFTSLIAKAPDFKDVVALLIRMKTVGVYSNKYTLNLLSQRVKQNPRQTLEGLFESCGPEDVFQEHLFNRLVGEACKADASCLELVVPHADLIAKQKDSVIIFYARMLEYSGAADTALKILESIETKTFDYYNIKANCLKAADFQQALALYKQALEITEDKDAGQKVIVYNNMAQLIFDHEQTDLYAEAAEYCKAALKLRAYHQFPYPGDLLLFFTIHGNPVDTVKENVEEILKTYKINRRALPAAVDKIDDPEKKKRLLEKEQPA